MDMEEKECPYCSGKIVFSIHDKAVKCGYCGRTIDVSKYNPQTEKVQENKYVDVNKRVYHLFGIPFQNAFEMIVVLLIFIAIGGGIIFGCIEGYKSFNKNSRYEEITKDNIDYSFINDIHEGSLKTINEQEFNTLRIENANRVKTYVENTTMKNSDGYNVDNYIFDIYEVQLSDGTKIYQSVVHSRITIIDGATDYSDDAVGSLFKLMNSGSIEKDLKMELNGETIYGSRTLEEMENNYLEKSKYSFIKSINEI